MRDKYKIVETFKSSTTDRGKSYLLALAKIINSDLKHPALSNIRPCGNCSGKQSDR